jgi:protoheme IX farnesyltransferase
MGSVSDYIALLKPRVMSLVIFTAFVGLMLAPGPCIRCSARSRSCASPSAPAPRARSTCGTTPTSTRSCRARSPSDPAGKITPDEALAFGITLSIGSVLTLGPLLVNWFAGAFLAFTIGFYVIIYTMWLKRSTPQNIVIGGAAGAFPPMIGWAAVTGGVSLESLVLFLIIFMWTPPHFWALALFKNGDYAAAGADAAGRGR